MTGMQPSMQHDATGQLSRSTEAASALVEALSGCNHHACGEESALLSHDNRTAIHPGPVTVVIAILPSALGAHSYTSETPPLRTPSLVSLNTILRV
jgi:hypothetical protein